MEQVHPKRWKDDQVKAVRSAIQQEKLCKLSDEAHGKEAGETWFWAPVAAMGDWMRSRWILRSCYLAAEEVQGVGTGVAPNGVARAAINFEGADFGGLILASLVFQNAQELISRVFFVNSTSFAQAQWRQFAKQQGA